MIMLMYTIEMIVLMLVVTILIALLAIFFIMKKSKKNITIKIISILTILVLTWIGGILWMWGPLPGYTKEFKKSGNPLTNYELIGYKNEKFHGAGGGISPNVRIVESCMSQQDFNTDIAYINSIDTIDNYQYQIPKIQSEKCELIDMSHANQNQLTVGGFEEYRLENLGETEGITVFLENDISSVIDFNNSKVNNVVLLITRNYKGEFKIKSDGIEKVNKISIDFIGSNKYQYNIKDGDLDKFLKDWGYIDKDGYYGKYYPNPNNK